MNDEDVMVSWNKQAYLGFPKFRDTFTGIYSGCRLYRAIWGLGLRD